jgi:hypothetical protein
VSESLMPISHTPDAILPLTLGVGTFTGQ